MLEMKTGKVNEQQKVSSFQKHAIDICLHLFVIVAYCRCEDNARATFAYFAKLLSSVFMFFANFFVFLFLPM